MRVLAFLGGALINPLLLAIVARDVRFARPSASWRPEWPVEFPGVIPDRSTSRIGAENARRNPQRTASTAAALMIGLALVTLVATLAAGIITSFKDAVNDLFVGDYAITAQNNFSPIPIDAAEAAAKAPGVTAIGNVRTGEALVFGDSEFATAVDPGDGAGDRARLEGRLAGGLLATSARRRLRRRRRSPRTTTSRSAHPSTSRSPNGTTKTFVVKGIFDPPTGGSPFGNVTMSTTAWDSRLPQPRNLFSFVKMEGGDDRREPGRARRGAGGLPEREGADAAAVHRQPDLGAQLVLNILYVLLALSVIVSLFGIVNTLVLTVFERTREIGMLRAIGMTRRQVRRMIRHESVITALIGAALGIVLGIVLAALLIARVDFLVFSFPTTQVIVFVIAAIVVGIVAAIFPARRAAKLDPLRAIAYE